MVLCWGGLASCKVEGGVGAGPQTPATSSPPPGNAEPAPATTPASAGGTAPGTGAPAATPECPTPQNQCLNEGDLFVGDKAFDHGHFSVYPAVMQEQPSSSGEAKFVRRDNGQTVSSSHYWSTHVASADEVLVGKLAIFPTTMEQGIYRVPQTTKEANRRWLLARIVNVANKPDGYVITSSQLRVRTDAIRVIEGDKSPTVAVSGAEDSQFLKEGHWLIGSQPLPKRGHKSVYPAAAVKLPSPQTKGEGQFYNLSTGELVWTANAWQTRAADKDSLKVGQVAFFYTGLDHGVYQPPPERRRAMGRWLVAKISDTSQLYKGVFTGGGRLQVTVKAARVLR